MSKVLIKIKDNIFKSAHVVIVKNNKVLLLKRSETDEWKPNHYGLPGGKLNPGETLSDALVRECKEETNLNISPKNLIFLSKTSNDKEHAFFCTDEYSGEIQLNSEHTDFQWVNPKNLSNYKIVSDLPEIIFAALENLT